ncbi:MAG: hypothetical protein AAGJ36_05780, partial [Pseudomonadota bacterium]
VRNDVREQLDTIESEFEADPTGFEEAAAAVREGILKGAPPEFQPQLELEMDARIGQRRHRVAMQFERREREAQRVEILHGLNGLEDDVNRAMREGDVEFGQSFADQHDAAIDEAVRTGILTSDQAVARRGALEDAMIANTQIGYTERALASGGAKAGREVIAEFQSGAAKELGPRLADRITASMQNLVSAQERAEAQRQRKLDAMRKEQVGAIRKQWADADFLLREGRTPDNLNELVGNALATADADLIRDIVGDVQAANAAAEFASLRPTQQAETLRRMQDATRETASADQLRLVQRFEAVYGGQQKLLRDDPMTLALNKGLVDPLPPLSEEGALQDRAQAAAVASESLGVPVPALTGPEIDQMARQYAQSDAADRLEMLAAVTNELGAQATDVFRAMDSRDFPMLSMMGSLMLDNPTAAASVLSGQDIIAANAAILPPKVDLQIALNDAIGTAYLANPRVDASVRQAITAAYADYAAANGRLDGIAIDSAGFDAAVRSVTGGIVEYGSQKLPAPDYGVTDDQFDDWIDSLDASTIEAMGGVSVPVNDFLRLLRTNQAQLVPVGSGRYQVVARTAGPRRRRTAPGRHGRSGLRPGSGRYLPAQAAPGSS